MRFLKAVRDLGSPENDAVTARLSAVTSRGKVEVSSYHCAEAQSVERRFFAPDDVEASSLDG